MPQAKPSITGISTNGKPRPASKNGSWAVTYGLLSRALERLGYERREAKGRLIMFVHPKSKGDIILPWRPQTQTVDPTRLAGVYQLVASGGVASREVLDAALQHA